MSSTVTGRPYRRRGASNALYFRPGSGGDVRTRWRARGATWHSADGARAVCRSGAVCDWPCSRCPLRGRVGCRLFDGIGDEQIGEGGHRLCQFGETCRDDPEITQDLTQLDTHPDLFGWEIHPLLPNPWTPRGASSTLSTATIGAGVFGMRINCPSRWPGSTVTGTRPRFHTPTNNGPRQPGSITATGTCSPCWRRV